MGNNINRLRGKTPQKTADVQAEEEVLYDRPSGIPMILNRRGDEGTQEETEGEVLYDRTLGIPMILNRHRNKETQEEKTYNKFMEEMARMANLKGKTSFAEQKTKDSGKQEVLDPRKKQELECHPELPFLRSPGVLQTFPGHERKSYLKYILKVIGERNIPRSIQAIIKDSDFEIGDTSSRLFCTVRKLKASCNVVFTDEAEAIRKHLFDKMNITLHELRKTRVPLFQECTAVLLGSAAEGTKTFHPGEWDFVIFLPYLSECYKQHFPLHERSVKFTIYPETMAAVNLMMWKYKQTHGNFEYHSFDLYRMLKAFVDEVLRSVMEGMTYKGTCYIHKAAACTYTYNGLDIKLDISFGIRDECCARATCYPMLVRPLEDQPPYGFFILSHDDGNSNIFTPTYTFKEVRHMRSLSDNVRLCYQVVKCLTELCIPPFYSGECTCKRALFPSFKLKLILFYLSKYYKDEASWTEDQQSSRIIEIFVIYSMCLRYGTINNLLSIPSQAKMDVTCKHIAVEETQSADNPYQDVPLIDPEQSPNLFTFTDDDEMNSFFDQPHFAELRDFMQQPPFIRRYKEVILKSDVEECVHHLADLTDNTEVTLGYKDLFNQRDKKVFDADVFSEFALLLNNLKEPHVLRTAEEEILYERHFGSPVVQNRRRDEQTQEEEFQELQIIKVEGRVISMAVASDHDGELLMATENPNRVIKYLYNEVIQEILLRDRPQALCYSEDRITIAVGLNVVTYGYKDLSAVSTFKVQSECIALTRLEDGFVMSLAGERQIIKVDRNGDIIHHSDKIFGYPKQVITMGKRNCVAVLDRGMHTITGLSGDLKTTLFECTTHWIGDICWNGETNTIYAAGGCGMTGFSDKGVVVNNFNLLTNTISSPDIICYDMRNHVLLVQIPSSDKNLIMAFEHLRSTM